MNTFHVKLSLGYREFLMMWNTIFSPQDIANAFVNFFQSSKG